MHRAPGSKRLMEPFGPGIAAATITDTIRSSMDSTSSKLKASTSKARSHSTATARMRTTGSATFSKQESGNLGSGSNVATAIQNISSTHSLIQTSTASIQNPTSPPPPQTYLGTRVYSQPTPPPPSYRPSPAPFHPPLLSVALVCSGGALILLVFSIFLRRHCCGTSDSFKEDRDKDKESPMFGGEGTAYDEKYTVMGSLDSWDSMQASLSKGMGRMSIPVDLQPQTRPSLVEAVPIINTVAHSWNHSGSGVYRCYYYLGSE